MSSSDPNLGTKMIEQQSEKILALQKANEEFERRQEVCEKKWAELIEENQRNSEAVVLLKG